MAPVTFSELRDDRDVFDIRYQDLPILTRNLILHRYKNDTACLGLRYREGTDLASNTQPSATILSWIYTRSVHDSMCVQIHAKEWDETSTFYVFSSFPQVPESLTAEAFKLCWSKMLQCYQPVPTQQNQREFLSEHPELVSKHYSMVLACAYTFVSYLHTVAETMCETECKSLERDRTGKS